MLFVLFYRLYTCIGLNNRLLHWFRYLRLKVWVLLLILLLLKYILYVWHNILFILYIYTLFCLKWLRACLNDFLLDFFLSFLNLWLISCFFFIRNLILLIFIYRNEIFKDIYINGALHRLFAVSVQLQFIIIV